LALPLKRSVDTTCSAGHRYFTINGHRQERTESENERDRKELATLAEVEKLLAK
jgi:hypothetical protein